MPDKIQDVFLEISLMIMTLEKEISLLNEAQKEAVMHFGTPLLILAGPGSGKTRVITIKIALLIKEMDVYPNKILAMTFTNKAAKEMKERIRFFINIDQESDEYAPRKVSLPFISTFHSCGAYLLRRFFQESGLKKDFQIYDAADQLALLKEANPKLPKNYLKATLSRISRAKDYGLAPTHSEEELLPFMEDIDSFKNYEELKKSTGNVDFGDLLIKPYQLFKSNQEVKNAVQKMWHWFFVDEYQDTNTIQSMWLTELCQHTDNITVVGDDDQSIYRFRGAVIENILNFEEKFPKTKVIHLGQNYRSTPEIVNLANEIIGNNHGRYDKTVFSYGASGDKPRVYCFENEYKEEERVVLEARQAIDNNETMAVFYRTNALSRGYEMALRKAHIPYEVVGTIGFFERAEVKDAIALIRTYKNSLDIISFSRIVNKPSRGIGSTSLNYVLHIMGRGTPWMEAWRQVGSELNKKAKEGFMMLEKFLVEGKEIHNGKVPKGRMTIGDIIRLLLEKSGIWHMYEKEDAEQKTDRIDNLEELISYATDYDNSDEGWVNFFEQISLNEGIYQATERDSHVVPIQLITLHRSKGLEFDRVVICGVEEGLIPMVGVDSDIPIYEEIEEERRLFYVGITRAKKHLAICHAECRRRYGRLEDMDRSPFLNDFNENLVEWIEPKHKTNRMLDKWRIGDRVIHNVHGGGYVRNVVSHGRTVVLHIEFDNEYEASFIPKFSHELTNLRDEYES